ncbi:clostripain-related cysteine peptidase [Hyalangium versicolor]|uniref:clostripain-related cysteine peptidase n=1 Tax=Hyalangium versicolor TaxID=2861190 RepID=UPI001CCB0146|nr:clostripain-related cysteine peptidase [Hyalangium versicolor]
MKVQNPSTTSLRSTSSSPSTKALPPSRGNQVASQRPADGFESKNRFAQPTLLTGEQTSRARPTTTPSPAPTTPASTDKLSPKDIPAADWTMFVHLNADNNLESYGKDDMNEMEAGGGSIPGKLNLIALVDGGTSKDSANNWSTGARLMYLTQDPSNSKKVVSREIDVDPSSDLGKLLAAGKGELDTGSPEVLRAAVDYVQRNVESNHFMVDLWDHGNGWRGVSYDDHPASDMNMVELQKALSDLPKKVDILSADACLMATVEVADTAKAMGADYLVGSEEVEPGTGWDYKDLLGRMGKLFSSNESVSPEQMAKAIQESYAAGPRDNVTMSVTDLSKLDGLNSKLNDFSDALVKAGGLQDKALRSAYDKTLRFDDADQMDLGDFAKRISQATTNDSLKQAAEALLTELAKTTVEKGAKGDAKFSAATGLTIYGPRGTVDSAYKKEGSAWLDSHWNNVIKTYSATSRA